MNYMNMSTLGQTLTLVDALAITLSIVSLTITIVGFFASLKFYRDGVEHQQAANDALTKLEQKTQFIQTQVGGIFDKTLEAAIGKRQVLYESFEGINQQLEKAKDKIIEESVKQIGDASEQELNRLKRLVDSQIDLIRQKVETTRESAEEIAEEPYLSSPLTIYLLKALHKAKDGLTLEQVFNNSSHPIGLIDNRLEALIKLGYLEKRDGRYRQRSE